MQVLMFGVGSSLRRFCPLLFAGQHRRPTTIASRRTGNSIPHTIGSIATLFFLLTFFTSCKTAYTVADFDSRTASHKTIAVLPFEMIFTGKKPEKLTDADLQAIAEAESRAFMISFHNELLHSARAKKSIRVTVQHYDKTISMLNANGIDLRSAWNDDPVKLANLLGVDAVVKARIQKHRLMSDLASYGIDLGVHLINVLSNNGLGIWLPGDLSRTNEIKASYSLIDQSGSTLWSIAFDKDADWSWPANEIIDGVNRMASKKFPYRK